MFIGSKSQRGRFKQKEGGRLRGTDYVFHFHFALCLNKQLPTALFSKPTFSQLLPGATERESHTQNVQGLLDFHTLFTQQPVSWMCKPLGALLGGSHSLAEPGYRAVQGGFAQTPQAMQGGASILASFCASSLAARPDLSPSTQPQHTSAWKMTLNPYSNSYGRRPEKVILPDQPPVASEQQAPTLNAFSSGSCLFP